MLFMFRHYEHFLPLFCLPRGRPVLSFPFPPLRAPLYFPCFAFLYLRCSRAITPRPFVPRCFVSPISCRCARHRSSLLFSLALQFPSLSAMLVLAGFPRFPVSEHGSPLPYPWNPLDYLRDSSFSSYFLFAPLLPILMLLPSVLENREGHASHRCPH